MGESRTDAGGVRKAPRHEIAVEHVTAVPRVLWGFGRGGWLDEFGLKCRRALPVERLRERLVRVRSSINGDGVMRSRS